MDNNKNGLILNLDKLHTTDMGVIRIRKNLSLDTEDVVHWCKKKYRGSKCIHRQKG